MSETIIFFLKANYEWVFSGIGATIVSGFLGLFFLKRRAKGAVQKTSGNRFNNCNINILQNSKMEVVEAPRKNSKSRAQLQARIVQYGYNNDGLMITNNGDSEARNIVLRLDGQLFEDHCASVKGEKTIKRIGAYSDAKMLLLADDNCCPPWEIEISWEDDSGEIGNYRSTLTF